MFDYLLVNHLKGDIEIKISTENIHGQYNMIHNITTQAISVQLQCISALNFQKSTLQPTYKRFFFKL